MAPKNKTVIMRARISGTRNGADWPHPGEEITLPADEADALLANGMAATTETATALGGVETATTGNQPLRLTAAEAKAAADEQAAAKAREAAAQQEAAAKQAEDQAKENKAAADAEAKAATEAEKKAAAKK